MLRAAHPFGYLPPTNIEPSAQPGPGIQFPFLPHHFPTPNDYNDYHQQFFVGNFFAPQFSQLVTPQLLEQTLKANREGQSHQKPNKKSRQKEINEEKNLGKRAMEETSAKGKLILKF